MAIKLLTGSPHPEVAEAAARCYQAVWPCSAVSAPRAGRRARAIWRRRRFVGVLPIEEMVELLGEPKSVGRPSRGQELLGYRDLTLPLLFI